MQNTKDTEAVVLNVDGISDIRYESVVDMFTNSIHKDVYWKAFRITEEIIAATDAINDGSNEEKGTESRNKEQIGNIIFFTGERGTGKTSAMLSYMEFLKDYYRKIDKAGESFGRFRENKLEYYMFTGIDYIDASSLDKKEDILGIVLSKMLKKWTDEESRSRGGNGIVRVEDYDYKKRQLRLQFNNVYERLKDLRNEKDITQQDDDMFLETLERLSFTGNLKESFKTLVDYFLDIMCYPGSEKRITGDNHYLVISIDDLDLNINNGFMLLEQIRKYLMLPKVIVLLSANYEQLEKICYNHYINEFDKIKKEDGNTEYIKSLTREYLEKIIPLQRQIILKAGRKRDFYDRDEIEIRYKKDKEKRNEKGSLQKIIFSEYNKFFRARFMKNGKCIYALTPDTVRELCRWINQMVNLKVAEDQKQEKDKFHSYVENINWFLNDEFTHLCNKYLDYSEQKIMGLLDTFDLPAQIILLKRVMDKNCGKNQSLLEILMQRRQNDVKRQHLYCMIVLYFTMKLSSLRAHMDYVSTKLRAVEGEDKTQLERELEKLRIQFGEYYSMPQWGIWGSWESEMTQYMTDLKVRDVKFYKIGWTRFRKTNKCLRLKLPTIKGNYDVDKLVEYVRNNKEILVNYQYVLLFYKLDIDISSGNVWRWKEIKPKEKMLLNKNEPEVRLVLENPPEKILTSEDQSGENQALEDQSEGEQKSEGQSGEETILPDRREEKSNSGVYVTGNSTNETSNGNKKDRDIHDKIIIELENDCGGIFSLSGFVLNLLDDAKLVKEFIHELPRVIYNGENEDELEKIKEVCAEISIIPEIEEDLGKMFLPLDSIEYLLETGKELEMKSSKGTVGGGKKQVEEQIRAYFNTLLETLQDFDSQHETDYKGPFENCKLVEKINDDNFIKLLGKSIKKHVEYTRRGYIQLDREWVR